MPPGFAQCASQPWSSRRGATLGRQTLVEGDSFSRWEICLRTKTWTGITTLSTAPGFTGLASKLPMPRTFTIAIGSDHAGFTYKEAIKAILLAEGHTVRD